MDVVQKYAGFLGFSPGTDLAGLVTQVCTQAFGARVNGERAS
jgi:hypothetical protein